MDKALASLVIANGAASAGKKATIFFTFWGLNVIKRMEELIDGVESGGVATMLEAADSSRATLFI